MSHRAGYAGRPVRSTLWLVGHLLAAPAWGHGDMHGQIEQVSAQIRAQPHEVELRIKRARLLQLDENWAAAAADYDQAELLAPTLAAVHLGRGRLLLASGQLDEAAVELGKFLAQKPDHAEALRLQGQVEAKRSRPTEAAASFRRAVELSPQPEPDQYLEWARAVAAAGPDQRLAAIAVLDQGLARLGNLPALGLPATEYEIALQRYDAALARLKRLGASSPRPDTWLERQGDVLVLAGRNAAASENYRAALDFLSRQSPIVQARPATQERRRQLEMKLAKLSNATRREDAPARTTETR